RRSPRSPRPPRRARVAPPACDRRPGRARRYVATARAGGGGSVPRRGVRHRHPGGPHQVELENEFRVKASVDRVWQVLTDLERIAPCMPGAQLQEVEGDEHRGVVKVKFGPITAQYKGAASFQE